MNRLVSFAAALVSACVANKFAEGSESREAMKILGPMAATFAPLNKDGEVDFTNLPKMAARLSEWGVNRVMVGGTTGESITLTLEERRAITAEWLRIAPEYNIDVYVNVQMESLEESKALATEISKLDGVKGFFGMSTSYFKPRTIEALTESMAIVASGAPDLPFWYYHFPEKNGVNHSLYSWIQHVDASGKIPNLMGCKFTDEHIMDYNAIGDFKNKKYNMLMGRDEMLTSVFILDNGQGNIGSTHNFISYNVQVMEAWNAHEHEKARALQLKTIDVIQAWNKVCGPINCQKAILKMTGIDFGPLRWPQENISHEQEMELGTALAAIGVNITAEYQYHAPQSLYQLPEL